MATQKLSRTPQQAPAWTQALGLGVLVLKTVACGAPAPPPPEDIVQAARVIQDMSSHRRLQEAGFYGIYSSPKPSDFVHFISSHKGAVLWPPREGSPLTPGLDGASPLAAAGTFLPQGIAYRRNRPDPQGGRQVVYRADDRKGEIVVEGYSDPSAEPVLVLQWRFPE